MKLCFLFLTLLLLVTIVWTASASNLFQLHIRLSNRALVNLRHSLPACTPIPLACFTVGHLVCVAVYRIRVCHWPGLSVHPIRASIQNSYSSQYRDGFPSGSDCAWNRDINYACARIQQHWLAQDMIIIARQKHRNENVRQLTCSLVPTLQMTYISPRLSAYKLVPVRRYALLYATSQADLERLWQDHKHVKCVFKTKLTTRLHKEALRTHVVTVKSLSVWTARPISSETPERVEWKLLRVTVWPYVWPKWWWPGRPLAIPCWQWIIRMV